MTSSSIPIGLITTAFQSEHYAMLLGGKSPHNSALQLIAQLSPYLQDGDQLRAIVQSALPSGYDGDTLAEIDDMIESAVKKGFHENPRKTYQGPQVSKASQLLNEVLQNGEIGLYHNSSGQALMTSVDGGYINRVRSVAGMAAELYLQKLYFDKYGATPPAHSIKEVKSTLMAKARFDGPEIETSIRFSKHENKIVFNLADQEGHVIVIGPDGYEVTREPSVFFIEPDGMKSLPLPVPSDIATTLRKFQKLLGVSDKIFARLMVFAINLMRTSGPYFCLLVEGEHGSGKSILCVIMKMLFDPSSAPKLRLPRKEHDLMIQAEHAYVLLFDNISGLNDYMSDVLCVLSTGGGMQVRSLYTNNELQIFQVCRPFILNGINDVAKRPDLLERAVWIKLPVLETGTRRTEEEMLHEFEELLPSLLHAFFTIASGALSEFPSTKTPTSVRMADAAKWVVAAEPFTGFDPGTLLQAIEESQSEVFVEAMANDPIAVALMELVSNTAFTGRISDLFVAIKGSPSAADRSFPKTTAHLSKQLGRMRQPLEKFGVMVDFLPRTNKGQFIRVWLKEDGTFEDAVARHGHRQPFICPTEY